MSQPSLADAAIDAIAAVRAMDAGITNDHPQRHLARRFKRMAEDVLSQAFRRAHELAYQVAELDSLVREVREEAAAAQTGAKP